MSESAAPRSTRGIGSYHAHIYFRSTEERERALQVRECIGERFSVQLGRVHFVPVGPHTEAMFQVAFARDWFEALVSWLMLNRRGLSVLIHPNTGRTLEDHLQNAAWLGTPLALRDDVLANEPDDDVVPPVVPNTAPHLASDD